LIEYTLEVKTSSLLNSETSLGDLIFFQLIGSTGITPVFHLTSSFANGDTVTITKELNDIGTVECIEISTTSTDGWLFDYIKITRAGAHTTFSNGKVFLDYNDPQNLIQMRLCGKLSFPFLSFPFFLFFSLIVSPLPFPSLPSSILIFFAF